MYSGLKTGYCLLILTSSSVCHQTCVFHLSMHLFAISLKLLRSSNEQGSARRVHCIMCAVFSAARPHSHVASPSKYLQFCLCSLLPANPVRSRFRHLHVVQGLSYPLARLSLRLTVTLCGVVCYLLSHSLHRMILGENSESFTLRKKQFRDFSLLSAGCCPYREWASLVSCLVFSILAHTSHRMSDGAIPASKYRYSTLVGFRYHVTARHALFSSVFSFWAWGDLAQTGSAYSATECRNANAVVLIVFAFAPHFEFDFLNRLLRVATFIFVLCICCL